MARTRHNSGFSMFRQFKHMAFRRSELKALMALNEEGILTRHVNRLNAFQHRIPNPWDDFARASAREYQNKVVGRRHWFEKFDRKHYTRGGVS